MQVGDIIRTPRFCSVRISELFETEEQLSEAGYTEPTYWEDNTFVVKAKSLDMYHMRFAAALKNK